MDNTVLFDDMILDPLYEDNTPTGKNVPLSSWDVVPAETIVWNEGTSLDGADEAMDLDEAQFILEVCDVINPNIHKLPLEDFGDGYGSTFSTAHSSFNFSSEPIQNIPSAPDCATFAGDYVDKNNMKIVPSRNIDVPLRSHVSSSAQYARPADWETWKAAIQNLYINHNLTLDDVIIVMKHRHNFNATKKMYKSQFNKWKWRKYGSSSHPGRSSRPGTKSCIRQRALRTKALLYENTSTKLRTEALHTFHQFLISVKVAKNSSFFRVADESTECIAYALNLFGRGEPTRAGAYLRRGFLKLEGTLRNVNARKAFGLMVETLSKLLRRGRDDLAKIFLSHITNISATIATWHPLCHISPTLQRLQDAGADQLLQFVIAAYDLYIDWMNGLPTVSDFHKFSGKAERLLHEQRLGIGATHIEWKVREMASEYDRHMSNITDLNRESEDEFFRLEVARLRFQHDIAVYLEDFADRAQMFMDRIAKAYKGSTIPDAMWRKSHVRYYLRVMETFTKYRFRTGMVEIATSELKTFLEAFIRNKEAAVPPIFFKYVYALRKYHGMYKEADELETLLMSVPWRAIPNHERIMEEEVGNPI